MVILILDKGRNVQKLALKMIILSPQGRKLSHYGRNC